MTTQANFPNPGSPLVDKNGRLSPEWFGLLLALFNRTGGEAPPPDITTLKQDVADLFGQVNANASAVMMGALMSKIAYLERALSSQIAPIPRAASDLPAPVSLPSHLASDLPAPVAIMMRPAADMGAPVAIPRGWLMPQTSGSAGQILTSAGPNQAAAWSAPPGQAGRLLAIRVLSSGVYTPTPGTNAILVRLQAPGGAGGGSAATGAGQSSCGTGGGSGAYVEAYFTSGFSGITLTLGTAGTGVAGANGGSATNATFGPLITCPGGGGGLAGVAVNAPAFTGGTGPTAMPTITGGITILAVPGQGGEAAYVWVAGMLSAGSRGTASFMGSGANLKAITGSNVGTGYGSGGSGANSLASAAAQAGGNGQPAYCEVWEFA